MAIDLKEIIAARLGENYQLHERHLNRTLVAAQRVIGFDKVYARAEGAYLYDMDNAAYLDFLSGYSVFNIGRNHPVVNQAIRDKKLPGAVVVIVHQGKVIFRKAYGKRSLNPAETEMFPEVVFDLASLTKPIATAVSILLLVEKGKLRVQDLVAEHVPGQRRGLARD